MDAESRRVATKLRKQRIVTLRFNEARLRRDITHIRTKIDKITKELKQIKDLPRKMNK